MKKLLLALMLALMLPFAAPTFACAEECVPVEEATEETPAEDVCVEPSRGVPVNPIVMRNAMLQNYINKLEAVGGVYQEGWNRFEVMKEIFRIKKQS